MRCLKLFHRDILTVRSHQWKYYVEPYSGCGFQCAYCLYYRSKAYIKRLEPRANLLAAVARDLAEMPRKQIVYIGATVDPYQLLEKEMRWTRRILELLVEREIPVVILTKSPLILRDTDLLLALQQRGHLLVQFTVLTTHRGKARALEPGAPSVAKRLDAASHLARLGIPVHFHLSPLIPGLYQRDELNETVKAIAASGGRCIYSNILGMRLRNAQLLLDSVARLSPAAASALRSEYKWRTDGGKNVYSPVFGRVYGEMARLNAVCRGNNIDFICEFIPGLDVFKDGSFEQGIFRYGLPAVYQMTRVFETPFERKGWRQFRAEVERHYPAADDEYLDLVRTFWNEGVLFENTTVATGMAGSERVYYQAGKLDLRESVLTWD